MYIHNDLEPGRLESSDINSRFRGIFNDISDLYVKVGDVKTRQDIMDDFVEQYSFSINTLINKIQTDLLAITNKTTISLYQTDHVIYPTKSGIRFATHEVDYGRAVLNINSSKKYFTLLDIDNNVIADTDVLSYIQYYSTDAKLNNTFSKIIESDITNAFDPDPAKLYIRKCITNDDDVKGTDLVINLTMPDADSKINSMKIHTFPEGSVDIDEITYNNSLGNGFFLQNDYGFAYDKPIESARRLAYNFNETNVSKLSFKFSQTTRRYSGPYAFFIGLHALILEYNLYENISYIGFKFEKDDIAKIVNFHTNIMDEVQSMGTSAIDNGWGNEYVTYYIFDNLADFNEINENNAIYISTNNNQITPLTPLELGTPVDALYVLVKLTKYPNGNTPVLNTVSIQWGNN